MKTFLKSRGLLLLLSLAMMPFCAKAQVSVWDGTYTPWAKGTGTATDPFLIENASQLAYLAVRVNNGLDDNGNHISNPNLHYKLMVDVDLNSNNLLQWTPIGYRSSNIDYQLFGGHFDGNNHMVSGLYIRSADTCVGFFGCIYGAVVENLGINGVVSSNHESSIVSAGIIIGNARHSLVKNCYSMGNVYSNGSTGGIIGFAMEDTITNCYNTANVLSNYSCSGGIIGSLSGTDTSIVINCYNTGQISSKNNSSSCSGGIIGRLLTKNIIFKSCYNVGNVSAYDKSKCGGVLGYYQGGGIIPITNYYLSTCGGNNTYGGIAMNDSDMRDPAFVATLNQGLSTLAWKSDYSKPINNGYPILKWQYSDAESCGAPENLSASVNASALILCWNRGNNALYYVVEYGKLGETAQRIKPFSCQVQIDCQPGETYFWRVKSICSFGESGFVNGSNVSTGIAEVKAVPSLKIYPNPTDGKFTVSGVNCNRLQVSDMYGKVLGTFEANGETTVLDFTHYAAGVYVIRAWDGARLAGIGKVVKR